MCFTNSFSVWRGDLELLVSPMRLATRKTWVSTGMAGWSNATARITLAVLRPTPGMESNESISEGTSLLNSDTSFFAIPTRFFALLLGYEQDLMYSYTASGVETAIISGTGNASNRAGVIMFTRLSVHCAERITATSN